MSETTIYMTSGTLARLFLQRIPGALAARLSILSTLPRKDATVLCSCGLAYDNPVGKSLRGRQVGWRQSAQLLPILVWWGLVWLGGYTCSWFLVFNYYALVSHSRMSYALTEYQVRCSSIKCTSTSCGNGTAVCTGHVCLCNQIDNLPNPHLWVIHACVPETLKPKP